MLAAFSDGVIIFAATACSLSTVIRPVLVIWHMDLYLRYVPVPLGGLMLLRISIGAVKKHNGETEQSYCTRWSLTDQYKTSLRSTCNNFARRGERHRNQRMRQLHHSLYS